MTFSLLSLSLSFHLHTTTHQPNKKKQILACINAVRTAPAFFADELRGLCDYDSFAADWNSATIRRAPFDALPALRATAHAQAQDNAATSKLSTNSSSGLDPTQRVMAVYPSARYAAELVAGGFSDVRSFVMALSCSQPHRSLLLSCAYDSAGAGIEFDQKKDDGSAYSPAPTLRTLETIDFACVNSAGCACSAAPAPPPPPPTPVPAPAPPPSNSSGGPGSTTFAITFAAVPDSASSDAVYSLMAQYAGAIAKFVSPSAVRVALQRASTADGVLPSAPLASFSKKVAAAEASAGEDFDGLTFEFNGESSSAEASSSAGAAAAAAEVEAAAEPPSSSLSSSSSPPKRRSLSQAASSSAAGDAAAKVAIADASVTALSLDVMSVAKQEAAAAATASSSALSSFFETEKKEAAVAEVGGRSAPVVATLRFTVTLSTLPASPAAVAAPLRSSQAEAEIARDISESLKAAAVPSPVSVALAPSGDAGSNLAFDVAVSFPPQDQGSAGVGGAALSAASLAARVKTQPGAVLSRAVARDGVVSSSGVVVTVDGIDVLAAATAALASGAFASPVAVGPPLASYSSSSSASSTWSPTPFPNGRVAGTSGAQTTQAVTTFDLTPTAPVTDRAAFDRAVWRAVEAAAAPVPVRVAITRSSATAPADAVVKVTVTFPPSDSVSATTGWASQQASRVSRALRLKPTAVLGADLAAELGVAAPPKPSNVNTRVGVSPASPVVSPAPPDLALGAPFPSPTPAPTPQPTSAPAPTTPPATTKPPPATTTTPPATTKPPPETTTPPATTKPPPATTTPPPATTKPASTPSPTAPPPAMTKPASTPSQTAVPAPTVPAASRLVLLVSATFAGDDGGAKAAQLAGAISASPETVLGPSAAAPPAGNAVVSLVGATKAP